MLCIPLFYYHTILHTKDIISISDNTVLMLRIVKEKNLCPGIILKIIFIPARSHNSNLNDNQNSPNRANTTPTFNNNVNNTSPGNPVGVVKGVQQAKPPESNSPVFKDVPPYR